MPDRHVPRICAVVCLAVALAWPAAAPPVLAAGQTARAGLPQATAVARQWQADAVLVSVSTPHVRANGAADEWKYGFYSSRADGRFLVTAQGARVEGRAVRLGVGTAGLGDFVDSDRIVEEALANGLKGAQWSMSLRMAGEGAAAGPAWMVSGGLEKGDVSVQVDARTGKFASRRAVE